MSCVMNMPPCSSFKLKTCPGLLESSPLGSRDSQHHAEQSGYQCGIAKRLQPSQPSPAQLADVSYSQQHTGGPAYQVSVSTQVHGVFNYPCRLAGVSWPQTCLSS